MNPGKRRRPEQRAARLIAAMASAGLLAAAGAAWTQEWTILTWKPGDAGGPAGSSPAVTVAASGVTVAAAGGTLTLATSEAPVVPSGPVVRVAQGIPLLSDLSIEPAADRGGHLVVWRQENDIVTQRVDPAARKLGPAVTVAGGGRPRREPAAAWLPSSRRFTLVWLEERPSAAGIYGRFLTPDGKPAGREIVVVNTPASIRAYLSAAAGGTPETLMVVWEERGPATRDLYVRAFGTDGAPRGPAAPLGAVPAGTPRPIVRWNAAAREFVAFWNDARGGGVDIHARRISPDGRPVGDATIVRGAPHREYLTAVAPNAALGRILLVWDDYRGNNTDIYAQVLGPDLAPVGSELAVAGGVRNQLHGAAVAADDAGWMVAWQDGSASVNYADWNILVRQVTADGTAPLPEVVVSRLPSSQMDPGVSYDRASRTAVAIWVHQSGQDVRDIGAQALARGYLPAGRLGLVVDSGNPGTSWAVVRWTGLTPLGTGIMMRYRTAARAEDLENAPWSAYVRDTAAGIARNMGGWLEADLRLESTDPGVSPDIREVAFQYRPR